jgi:hypothetical protein
VAERVEELRPLAVAGDLPRHRLAGLVADAEEPSQAEQAKAHNALSDAVLAGAVHHGNEPAMNTAVRAARWKPSVTRESSTARAPPTFPRSDDELWRIWQANDLDEWSQLAHIDALVHGRAFLTVWGDDDDPQTPRIAAESAHQMTVSYKAGTRTVDAALKRWRDDGVEYATLYLPDQIVRYAADAPTKGWTPATCRGRSTSRCRTRWARFRWCRW